MTTAETTIPSLIILPAGADINDDSNGENLDSAEIVEEPAESWPSGLPIASSDISKAIEIDTKEAEEVKPRTGIRIHVF